MVGVTQGGRGARCPPGRLNVKACISVFGIDFLVAFFQCFSKLSRSVFRVFSC